MKNTSPPNPSKILAHNILQAQIGRLASGAPIWDESSLFNTNTLAPFIEWLSAVHIKRSGHTVLPTEDVLNVLSTALTAEIESITDFCRLYAYSDIFNPADFPDVLRNTAYESAGVWLAKSDFRLFEFTQYAVPRPADVRTSIAAIGTSEGHDIGAAFVNLTLPSSILILNPAVYEMLSADNAEMRE